jgi:hypothetical protein
MRRLACFLGLSAAMLVGSTPVGAQEAPTPPDAPGGSVDCTAPDHLSHALVECGANELDSPLDDDAEAIAEPGLGAVAAEALPLSTAAEPLAFPAYCRVKVDVVVWGGTQWDEVAQALANDLSPCAEYYVSIPPQDGGDATQLRQTRRFEDIRALSPRIHPLAEIRFTAPNRLDWRELALQRGGDLDDFYEMGVEARRRMAAGMPPRIDLAAGETWAFNELTTEVLEDVPGWRAQVRAFLAGLYDGPPGAPNARGAVFSVAPFSDDSDVADYKVALQDWLEDEAFWSDLDQYADFFAYEVYANPKSWGVAGVPLAMRADSLNDYFFHLTALAEAGPESAAVARNFLRRTYLPLTNATWPHSLIGQTDLITAQTMGRFISTQVYAVRHYANSHPQVAPQGKVGFGWAPDSRNPRYSESGRNLVAKRLAEAIRYSTGEGTNPPIGACGPPGAHVWCVGDVEGATLNDVWSAFAFWDA